MGDTQFEKPATLMDVARLAGTSKSTASAALNSGKWVSPATREIVLKAARELNFQANPLAQKLSGGKTRPNISLFHPQIYAGTPMDKVVAIQRLLCEMDYEAPLHSSGNQTSGHETIQVEAIRRLRRQKPDAIVCFTMNSYNEVYAELEQYQKEGGIVVTYDHAIDLSCDQVVFDREDNTYKATRHLLDLGHRDIGFYNSGQHVDISVLDAFPSRVSGFLRAMAEFGLQFRKEWYFSGAGTEQGGVQLAAEFLDLKQRPTAMCIVNESVSWAFINLIARAGISVPQDLSIVSHDNLPLAQYVNPPLTTVSQPTERIAQQVVDFVNQRLKGEYSGPPRRADICGELIQRESALPWSVPQSPSLNSAASTRKRKTSAL